MRIGLLVLALLAPLFFAGSAEATTYTVCASGCSFTTIQAAANTAVGGDTVNVLNGTYPENLVIKRSGSSGSPITFRSVNKYGASIAPTSGGRVIDIQGNFITIQDFDIQGPADGSASIGVKCNAGTKGASQHCNVIGNRVHHIDTQLSCVSGAGISINSSDAVINGNLVYDVSPPRSAPRCNQNHGLYVTNGSNGLMQNNLVMQVWQGYGIQLWSGNYSGWSISNNTIVNVGNTSTSSGGPLVFGCSIGTCDNMTFNNNIFANTNNQCIKEYNNADGTGGVLGTHNQYRNNLLFNCAGGESWVNGNANFSGTSTADPLFVNYTGDPRGDYHLQAASPAINAGTRIGAPATDFDGNLRPPSLIWDGAYESLGWVLLRPTCSVKAVHDTWQFAERYSTPIGVSLIHYSLPYFAEGPDRQLQFPPEDRPAIERVVEEPIRLKENRPELLLQSVMALRSILDWLIKGPDMKVPCESYRLIW